RHALGGLARLAIGAEEEAIAVERGVEVDLGARQHPVERERQAADRGQVEVRVTLAPVFDERDVRARFGDGAVDAHDDVPPTAVAKVAKPARRHASSTALCRPGASAITQPPPPPPVSLAPTAPASRASEHMR